MKTLHRNHPIDTGLRFCEVCRRAIGNSKLEIGKGRLFFDDLLNAKVRTFNPRYAEAEGALLGQFRHLHTDISGILRKFHLYPFFRRAIR